MGLNKWKYACTTLIWPMLINLLKCIERRMFYCKDLFRHSTKRRGVEIDESCVTPLFVVFGGEDEERQLGISIYVVFHKRVKEAKRRKLKLNASKFSFAVSGTLGLYLLAKHGKLLELHH